MVKHASYTLRQTEEYEIFANEGLANPKIQEFITFLKQVRNKLSPASAATGSRADWESCDSFEACRRDLNAGASFAEALRPEKEKGTLYYQALIRKQV